MIGVEGGEQPVMERAGFHRDELGRVLPGGNFEEHFTRAGAEDVDLRRASWSWFRQILAPHIAGGGTKTNHSFCK